MKLREDPELSSAVAAAVAARDDQQAAAAVAKQATTTAVVRLDALINAQPWADLLPDLDQDRVEAYVIRINVAITPLIKAAWAEKTGGTDG